MIDTVCRHEWIPAGDAWACSSCDATSAACVAHNGPTGSPLLICEACVAKARAVTRARSEYARSDSARRAQSGCGAQCSVRGSTKIG